MVYSSKKSLLLLKEKLSLTETFLGGIVRLTFMQSINGEIKIFRLSTPNASVIDASQASLHALLNFSFGKEKLQYFRTRDTSRSEERARVEQNSKLPALSASKLIVGFPICKIYTNSV
jgi:hypothetical protein